MLKVTLKKEKKVLEMNGIYDGILRFEFSVCRLI